MDIQTIVLCVIGFLVTLVIWLIKDSQRKIEKRIDDYERKNEAEHSKLGEALAQQGKEFHAALAQQAKEFHAALAQQAKEHREALAQQGKELTALRVEVAKLTVPTEREILESLRQLATRTGMQEQNLPDGD